MNESSSTAVLPDIAMLGRRAASLALAGLLLGCSTAPSSSPSPVADGPGASPTPPASLAPQASWSLPTIAPPSPSPSQPVASAPPATVDPKYLGSLDVLSASPRAGFAADIECSGSIGQSDPVALVSLKGSDRETALRDYADVSRPRTACTFSRVDVRLLIDPRHVVIADDEAPRLFAIVDLPNLRYRWFALPKTKGWGSELITVGPALDRIVWKAVHAGGDVDIIKLSTAGRTRDLATLPDTNEGRCGSPTDSTPGR